MSDIQCGIRQFAPIDAVVDSRLFCVHGGLDPQLPTVEDLAAIDRFGAPELKAPLAGLLWSDPSEKVEN
jgi:serine/threonine-protein phosphatase 2B catalytic subunit